MIQAIREKDFLPVSEPTLESDSLLLNTSVDLDLLTVSILPFSAIDFSQLMLTRHSDAVADLFVEAITSETGFTMLPNFHINPSGKEKGDYLVIDLGGSTLRIAVVQINPIQGKPYNIVVEKKWAVENNNKVINLQFFKWMCSHIVETLLQQSVLSTTSQIHVGVSWSFPLKQTQHNSGLIQLMGKGYEVLDECLHKDLKEMVENTMKQNHDLDLLVDTLINDSLAVYAAGAFVDKYSKIAIVLGTGFNMCCALKNETFHSLKSTFNTPTVLVNLELSLFGQQLLPDVTTRYDTSLDARFIPKQALSFKSYLMKEHERELICQPAELLTSGRYLPELVRLILLDLYQSNDIFQKVSSESLENLYIPYDGFLGEVTCFISETQGIELFKLIKAKLFDAYGWENVSDSDVELLLNAVHHVVERAAYVAACMLISTIKLMVKLNGLFTDPILNIGYVGSVLTYFILYRNLILEYINKDEFILKSGLTVGMKEITDSSIVGAAVGAAFYA